MRFDEIKKGEKDANGYTRCWPGKHAEGTKKGKNGGQVRACVANESLSEGDVVAFPKKHRGDLASVNDCPKCGGDLQGGKYQGHEVKVCMPCKQVYLPPNSGIDQQGNPIKEMDGDGAGRDGSNRKSHSTYGSRDKHTVSNGPDVHLGPKNMMTSKDMQDRALDTLKKTMSKPENMAVLKRLKTKEGVAEAGYPEVDHMPGAVNRNPDRTTDVVKTNDKARWDRAVDSINAKVFDDMSDFTTDSKGETVTGNSAVWAKWDNARQTGWFNAKGRPLKPWPVTEQGVAEDISRRGFLKGAGAAAVAGASGAGGYLKGRVSVYEDNTASELGYCETMMQILPNEYIRANEWDFNYISKMLSWWEGRSDFSKLRNTAKYKQGAELAKKQFNAIKMSTVGGTPGSLKERSDYALTLLRQHYDRLNDNAGYLEEGVAEAYNAEYDDEAGMADNNLGTLRRAVDGLDDLIDAGDNLPEWCQEKIAVAKSMLVAVWDYMDSADDAEEEDPEIAEMYESLEQLAEELSARTNVDIESVWETFEALDNNKLYETAAWHRKEGKNKNGGLNAKGVASYRKEHPGSKLQTAVTTKPSKLKPGSKSAKRRKSFCARMSGVKGPMKKPNGDPTRKALALRKWNC